MSVSVSNSFKYFKLPESTNGEQHFRVLTLQPGHHGQPICVNLETCQLGTAQTYEALSYYWREPDLSHIISVSGDVFKISLNLKVALEHLRYTYRARRLWIDAICINQNDALEQTQQVNMMRDIYQTAVQVIVWLGPEKDESDRAFKMHRRLVVRYGNEWLRRTSGFDFMAFIQEAETRARSAEIKGMRQEEVCGKVVQPLLQKVLADLPTERLEVVRQLGKIGINIPRLDHSSGPKEPALVDITDQVASGVGRSLLFREPEVIEAPDHEIGQDIAFPEDDFDQSEDLDVAHGPDYHFYTQIFRLLDKYGKNERRKLHADSVPQDGTAAMRKLCRRPYFERAWIIQEIGVAKRCTVQCGRSKLDWGIFWLGMSIVGDQGTLISSDTGGYMFATESFLLRTIIAYANDPEHQEGVERIEPLHLLRRYREHKATNPQDKIYSLLGLAKLDLAKWTFKTDYTRTFVETYREFAIAHLQYTKKLHVISALRSPKLSPELPSWVPDWRDESPQPWALVGSPLSIDNIPTGRAIRKYTASGDSVPIPRTVGTIRLLLEGYIIDTIEDLGSVIETVKDIVKALSDLVDNYPDDQAPDDEALEIIRSFYLSCETCSNVLNEWTNIAGVSNQFTNTNEVSSISEDSACQAYIRTLLANVDTARLAQDCLDYHKIAHARGDLGRAARPLLDLTNYTQAEVERSIESEFQKFADLDVVFPTATRAVHAMGYTFERRFFKSHHGRFGLAGRYARAGDQIVLMKGADAPLVVRPSSQDLSAFEVICDACLDGAMDGEAWDENKCVEVVLV